ncbi:Protein SOGA2 [Toxocara canis]|uniref:Protein SOGA2 n=1 Tax=Toxocara canis TaxID=6265 RepID=A0A0B2VNG7_TOXCA|nr:Protein SOGA2 [Toxocara canis]
MSEASCSGFEPQTYLRDRCKKCFRLKSKHDELDSKASTEPASPTASVSSTSTRDRNREKRRSWRDKMSSGQDNSGPEHINEGNNEDDTTSCTSFKSANSKGLSSAKSMESITSNQDSRSMVTAMSESIVDEERAITPTESDSIDTSMMKSEIARLKEEVTKLKEERDNWTMRRRQKTENESEESLIELLEERLTEAENCIQDYRDENTVLKCELRELQEGSEASKITEKLKATESLCEELMEENEALKADVKDLQQEIEEMQDQYREEEIEEFRELQRELEQNAKNCRILQFKLRKSERVRDQLETEKQHLEAKVRDLLQASAGKQSPTPGGQAKQTDPIRIKELESELRIAKEVSVRLHNELEGAEEKRYKLEDEVFYLKEKCRELQTQTKWREARNKAEQQAKRISNDLSMSLNDIDLAKEMRDVLEREADLRDQLKFAEEDLKRTQLRLQDVENENEELMRKLTRATTAKRPPMVRSVSEGHTQIQLELAEHEVEHLSTKVDRLEKKNVHLAKKILEMEMDSKKFSREGTEDAGGNKYVRFDISPEMQRDMGKMIATISELERKNMELNLQLKRQSETCSPSSDETVQTELRIEKEHKKIIENELLEMKKLMLQSENQKLIALATKVELLNNQLGLANERYNSFHRKMVKEGDDDTAYVDALKLKCEELEKQLSEQKANAKLVEVQGGTATADEIEQCCEVLASVETQTNRICKQIEKLENAQKDERRRSLSKDNSATIIAELASVITELNNVHQLLEAHKLNNPSFTRKSPAKEMLTKAEIVPCEKCKENEAFIESQRDEIIFYKKKNKDLTNQVLQTEDRWTVEIEKQRQAFELEMKNLNMKLINAEKCVEEQNQLIESRTVALAEKSRMIQERDEKCERLKVELQKLKKEIQEIEADHKSAREYEIKYKKLESLYDKEREKFAQERNKSKAEVAALKKRSEDTSVDLEKLRNAHLKKETMWNEEKERLEAENTALREQIKMGGSAVAPDEPVYATIPAKTSTELDEKDSDKPDVIEMREHITLLEKMHTEQAIEISTLKLQNEELQSELSRTQQNWTRDKDNLQHKVRTDEKIRNVEFDALQQKFASRMKIMEETNKSLHSQLVQARRERDYNREALCTFERKVAEEQQRMEKETKRQSDLSQKCADMTKQIAMLEAEVDRVSTDLTLTKDAHNADKALWEIERSRFGGNQEGETVVNGNAAEAEPGSEKFTETALKAAETVQKQYAEYQKFYTKEVERLNNRIKELTNEGLTKQNESQRAIKELREQIKVLEISQRNLMQARDMQTGAKEAMEAEIEKLQETVHQSEVQRLTRKYKLCSIIDQLQTVIEPSYRAARHELDAPDMLRYILAQMKTINDEDATFTKENNEGCTSQASTSNHLGERTGPVGSESVGASRTDGIMNTSVSFKTYSYNSLPPASRKWGSHMATITTTAAGIENSSTWEFRRNEASARAVSPVKKIAAYPDPPPNFMLNKEMSVEYDKEGRLHYIPRTISRSASYDRQGESLAVGVNGERSSLTDDDDGMLKALHSRTSSTGTNILYKIRREELARGGQPSVRLMAKAFDSIEATVKKPQSSKRSLFSIRKSRSVETTETGRSIGAAAKSVLTPAAPSPMAVTVLGRNTSLSEIEQLMGSQSPYGSTLPRGGRNPFKNMGTKLVERVRRSLSRSSTGRNSTAPTDSETGSAKSGSRQTLNGDGVTEASPSGTGASSTSTSPKVAQGVTPTPVVAPKRTMKKKVKKAATTNLADITTKSSTTKTKS